MCAEWPQTGLAQFKWSTVQMLVPFALLRDYAQRIAMCEFAIDCNVKCFINNFVSEIRHQFLAGITILNL